jgi:AraC-like DNA-binding protein
VSWHRHLELLPVPALPGFPTLGRIAVQEVDYRGYRFRVGDRIRPSGVMQLTLSGCGRCRLADGREQDLPVGMAMLYHTLLHPEFRYWWQPAAVPWRFLYVDIDGAATAPCVRDLVATRGQVMAVDPAHALVADLIRRVPVDGIEHRQVPLAEAVALANGLLVHLASGVALAPEADRLVTAATTWMLSRVAEPVDVAAAARALGVSREHLSRVFTARLGLAPATWLRHRRLEAAARILGQGGSVASAAAAAGIATPAHLAQLFRRHFGVSPRHWRSGQVSAVQP